MAFTAKKPAPALPFGASDTDDASMKKKPAVARPLPDALRKRIAVRRALVGRKASTKKTDADQDDY